MDELWSRILSQFLDIKPCPMDWQLHAWKMSFESLEKQSSLWYLEYSLTVQYLSVV